MCITKPDHLHLEMYYQCADIFVSLSDNRAETFGLTIIEAMLSGLPVVVSEIAGYRSVVIDGITGFYVPTYSAPINEDLSYYSGSPAGSGDSWLQSVAVDLTIAQSKLETLLNDDVTLQSLSKQAQQYATKQFEKNKMLEAYADLFNMQVPLVASPPTHLLDDINLIMSEQVSNRLNLQTSVSISAHGKRVMTHNKTYVAFPKHTNERPFIMTILSVVAKEGVITLKTLVDFTNLDEQKMYSHVIYILKQGLIQIVKT